MTRLVALDLDGTVLSFDLKLDQRDVDALHRAVASGITVVACTGRPFPGALPWVRMLGLDQPIVCYQGAQVRTPDGATLLDQGVPHDLAVEVVRFARERDVHVQAYRDDMLIIERDRPEAHQYANHAGMQIHLVSDLETGIGATTPKLVMVARADEIEALLPEARARWACRLEANTSMPTYLEVTREGADKRRALEFLGYRDSGMAGTSANENPASFHLAPLHEAGERLAVLLREERPDVVVTYTSDGTYGHPDHIKAHHTTVAALDVLHREGWSPGKFYLSAVPRGFMQNMLRMAQEAGMEIPSDGIRILGVPDEEITTSVSVQDLADRKRQAFAAHVSQNDPNSPFQTMASQIYEVVFGTEHFVLARGDLGEELPERSLFVGVTA